MPSNDLSTEQTILAQPATSTSILQSDGLSQLASTASVAGSISTQEFETGTNELRNRLTKLVQSEISSAIESYILTDLILSLLTLSPGVRNQLLQKSVLEARCNYDEISHGQSCSFKFTIRLCSKSLSTVLERPLLSIPLDELWKTLFPTQTPLSSSGGSPSQTPAGETANDGGS